MENDNELEIEFYHRLIKLSSEFKGLEPEDRIHSMMIFISGDMYRHFDMNIAKSIFLEVFNDILEKTEKFDLGMRSKNE